MPVHVGGEQNLEVMFVRDPEELWFFLMQVAEFVREWGPTFPDEVSCVSYLGSKLEGCAARWYVTL